GLEDRQGRETQCESAGERVLTASIIYLRGSGELSRVGSRRRAPLSLSLLHPRSVFIPPSPGQSMGYDNDPYIDEDGEPLMDMDNFPASDDEQPQNYDAAAADIHDFNDDGDDWRTDPSPSAASKPRKRLIKKTDQQSSIPSELNDFEDDGGLGDFPGVGSPPATYEREQSDYDLDSSSKKRKRKGGLPLKHGSDKRHKEKMREKHVGSSSGGKGDAAKLNSRKRKGNDGDPEMKEMWDTVAGGDSEDDKDDVRTVDDDYFIDDTGLDPAERYRSDNEAGSPSHFAQADEGEEDDEINALFKMGKKKKKNEKSAQEISFLVEQLIAEFEVAAEDDAILNSEGKPAINKLKKLPLLTEALSKKQLQHEFLDHGVLTSLKTWLEPLPDGSLPNINIREAILRILTDFPLDLEQHDAREQLKRSGLGKVIMFLSRSDEETTSNRKLAKDLVDKWSRPIFNKSTRFEDMRNADDERVMQRRAFVKKPTNKTSGLESKDDDLDLHDSTSENKSGQSSRLHASRPEAMAMDFVVRPQSRIDPDEIRARAKQQIQDQRRLKMNKKLQHLKSGKKKQLQATRVSVEGRGMVKYL
ncbi:hypothetical protein V2J09_010890, partial [Rumex salicifolius]